MKKPKISLKTSKIAMQVLLVLFSCGYALYFIQNETLDIVFGVFGFLYFYSLYTFATHLYLAGAVKMKPDRIFWCAFFSSAIPLAHLIVPIHLLKASRNQSIVAKPE